VVICLPEGIFVVPYARHSPTFDAMSVNANGYKQFHVDPDSAEGPKVRARGRHPDIALDVYRDRFDFLGS
jgi:hypothetical protein